MNPEATQTSAARPISAASLPSEIWLWSATQIAAQVRARTVSCVEVLRAFLLRIDAVNPRLNAIVCQNRGRAMAAAEEADALLRSAPKTIGPLHGVPVTIKLNADVADEVTSNGVPAYVNRIAQEDSAVVANLRSSGAILIGRTNVPPFSYRWFSENPLHGRTLNPWSSGITSGGSSGGAAVAVAAGMCAFAHGTDIAGSIRYPAYVNGLVGLRPTPGRVPAYNPTAPIRYAGLQMFSAQGPLAHHVQDAALAMNVMASSGFCDPTWVDAPLVRPDDAQPCRVALVTEIPNATIAPEVYRAVDQAATALAEAGYEIEPANPPGLDEALDLWFAIVMAEVGLGMMSEVEATGDPSIIESVRAMAKRAPAADLRSYATALARRDILRRRWNEFFIQYPLVLLPTSCRPPMPWGADLEGVERMHKIIADQTSLFAAAVLSLPGVNVPTGVENGIPLGVQLIGPAFHEGRLLSAAQVIEDRVDMPRPSVT